MTNILTFSNTGNNYSDYLGLGKFISSYDIYL